MTEKGPHFCEEVRGEVRDLASKVDRILENTDCITKRLGIDWNNLWRISGSWESYNGWYCSMEKFLRPGKTERLASRILSDKQGLGRSAQPGLSPYMNCAEKEIIIPEAIYDGAHWDDN